MLKSLFAATALLAAGSTLAQDAADERVRAAIKALVPEAKVDQVEKSVLPGFYEVVTGGQVIYVSADGQHVFSGVLWDAKRVRNLTADSTAKIVKPQLDAIGPEKRIIYPAADEKYVVTVFTDVDCGVCQNMHLQMPQYNAAGISVHYLFSAFSQGREAGLQKAVAVWCSADRRAALDLAKAGKPIEMKTDCVNPKAEHAALSLKLGIRGTPAIFTKSGYQIGGYLPPEQMLARLQELESGR